MKKLLLTLVAVFALGLQVANAQTGYGIFFNDVEITSANASNFTTSGLIGTVSYNASTHVLTLNNVSASMMQFRENTADITVIFSGNCEFSNKVTNTSGHKVTLQGQNATAQLTSGEMGATYVGSDLELTNGIFRLNEDNAKNFGLWGWGNLKENLIITNAEVYVCGQICAVDDWNSITFNGCQIVSPVGAAVDSGCIRVNGVEVANQIIHIASPQTTTNYGIFINNTQINSANAANFSAPNLTGTVTYDDATHVLTLDNVSAETLSFVSCYNTDITVNFSGNCQFSDLVNSVVEHNVTFQGQNAQAILAAAEVLVEDANLEFINGTYRFNTDMSRSFGLSGFGPEHLTITNADVSVGGSYSAIYGWRSIILNNCEIVAPVGAVVEDGSVKLNGNEIANQIVHIAPVVAIDIVRTTEFAVVPNPATDETVLMLEPYTGTATMQIVDINGRVLTTVMLPAQQENYRLDVSTLAAGTYFINVTANGTRQTATLLKK